jgi:CBS domain-containing protein
MTTQTKLRDIMTRDVLAVAPDVTLRQAVTALTERGVTAAPVVVGGELVGVISTTDILEFVAITPPVPTVQPDQTEWGELELTEDGLQEDENESTFYRDLWSDAGADVLERFAEAGGPEWDLLSESTVESIMTRRLVALPSNATAAAAARSMLEEDVHRVLVTEEGRLVGIVTSTDLLRVLADS